MLLKIGALCTVLVIGKGAKGKTVKQPQTQKRNTLSTFCKQC